MKTFEETLLFNKVKPEDLTEEQYTRLNEKYNELLRLDEEYQNMPEPEITMMDYATIMRPTPSMERLDCLSKRLELLIDINNEIDAIKNGSKVKG